VLYRLDQIHWPYITAMRAKNYYPLDSLSRLNFLSTFSARSNCMPAGHSKKRRTITKNSAPTSNTRAGFCVSWNARANDVTFNPLPDRYIAEEMPARHATKGSYTSIVNRRLRLQWGGHIVSEIRQQRFMRGSSRSTLRP
jgi:hypothetical protein